MSSLVAGSEHEIRLERLEQRYGQRGSYGCRPRKSVGSNHRHDLAPTQVEKVMRLFSGMQKGSVSEGGHVLTYTFHHGPAIDERMFAITSK
jgi:hypothetical protein